MLVRAAQQPIPPPYKATCDCGDCTEASTHVIVLHFWPVHQAKIFRNRENSVKMFPAPSACKEHSKSMHEIGTHFIDQAMERVREHFSVLQYGLPDMRDILIECVTKEEALSMWKERLLN